MTTWTVDRPDADEGATDGQLVGSEPTGTGPTRWDPLDAARHPQ